MGAQSDKNNDESFPGPKTRTKKAANFGNAAYDVGRGRRSLGDQPPHTQAV
jgi:hypothetical protein